jgi:hypothetical protein
VILSSKSERWGDFQSLCENYGLSVHSNLFYYNFKDEKGKEYSFSIVKDESYELLIEDGSSMFGQGINPKYENKYFDIFYQVEKHDLLGWGGTQDYDVVIEMILVE